MKIGILTHYNVNNQGAQLQLYSLYCYLEDLGHTPYVLTYQKNFDFLLEEAKKNTVSLSSIPYYMKHYMLEKGFGLTKHNAEKYLKLKKFREKRYRFLPYHSEGLDLIIIGSDEVFSIDVGINPMMYGHNLRCSRAAAYAPAFGRTTLDLLNTEGCLDLVRPGLVNMWKLSARDEHTQTMIKELAGRDVPLVCDPVFLYDFSKNQLTRRLIKKPYLLVYSYDAHMKEPEEYRGIQAYAKKKGMITVSAGTYHKWCDMNIACDPLEWAEYIRQASCVITDTFHGYVMALKMRQSVALYVRSQINSQKLQSIMKETGTTDRELHSFRMKEIHRVLSRTMDYNTINSKISRITESGINYLDEVLQEANYEK